jgi:hypothetical protein
MRWSLGVNGKRMECGCQGVGRRTGLFRGFLAKVATLPLNGFVMRLSDSGEAWNTLRQP